MEKIEVVTSWNHRPTPIRRSKRWKDVKVIKVHRYRDVDLGDAPCGLALDVIYERRKMQPHELSSCHSHRTHDRALLYIFAFDRGFKLLLRESFDIFASDNTRIFHCDLPWQEAYGYCHIKVNIFADADEIGLKNLGLGETFTLHRYTQCIFTPSPHRINLDSKTFCYFGLNPNFASSPRKKVIWCLKHVLCERSIASTLSKNFASKAAPAAFADFVLECEGQSFPCHRFMLASRSNSFKGLFKSGLSECAEGKLVISDTSPQALREFIHFLYADNASDVPQQTSTYLEVLRLVHKYLLYPRRDNRQYYELASSALSAENVVSVARFACDHEVPFLKSKVADFLFFNSRVILKQHPSVFAAIPKPVLHGEFLTLLLCAHAPKPADTKVY